MKFISFLALCLLTVSLARAEGPDDQYVNIYNGIQEADRLNKIEQISQALAKYGEAQAALQKFQQGYPDWNPSVVRFRLDYANQKIAELTSRLSTSARPADTPGKSTPAPAPGTQAPDAAVLTAQQIKALQEQV